MNDEEMDFLEGFGAEPDEDTDHGDGDAPVDDAVEMARQRELAEYHQRQLGREQLAHERMGEIADEFPEFAEALISDRNATAAALHHEVTEATRSARSLARLDLEHPGWESDVRSDDFVQWVRQDEDRVRLARSDNPDDASALMTKWRRGRGNQGTEADLMEGFYGR